MNQTLKSIKPQSSDFLSLTQLKMQFPSVFAALALAMTATALPALDKRTCNTITIPLCCSAFTVQFLYNLCAATVPPNCGNITYVCKFELFLSPFSCLGSSREQLWSRTTPVTPQTGNYQLTLLDSAAPM